MKDNSFERAMNQIVGQAEAEQERELQLQRRRQLLERIRKISLLVCLTGGLAATFCYRAPIQDFVSSKLGSITKSTATTSTTPTGAATVSIAKAHANASLTDKVINDASK
jgi:hypothetical protein